MVKTRILSAAIVILAAFLGYFVYSPGQFGDKFKFRLGLDLSGGTHLVYRADVSKIPPADVSDSMESLRDVIERRVNAFGVSEPLVQIETGRTGAEVLRKLIVELPGVTDVEAATEAIGATPLLEFMLAKEEKISPNASSTVKFVPTGITGRLLKRSELRFDSQTGEPAVSLTWNDEGKELFAKVTRENVGEVLAIFLDGQPISLPVIRQEIKDGKAEITGDFTLKEGRRLVRDLNYGALPAPINLVGTQSIGASLGGEAVEKGLRAGVWSFVIIALFLVLWYRLPGVVAVVALAIYVAINLTLFKVLPGPLQITLTSAGIAAFILSIGMAVDANILIFERVKEELRGWKSMPAQGGSAYSGGKEELARGRSLPDAIKEGFARAWTSIRDSNLSSIITAVILYWFASTSLIKGFALVFFIGVMTSMFTAIVASRTLLVALGVKGESKAVRFLFDSGVR